MPKQSIITDRLRSAVGVLSDPVFYKVDKDAIAQFTHVIGDCNPIYTDESHASSSRHGRIIAPPTFLRSMEPPLPGEAYPISYPEVFDGGSQWEYFESVGDGDTISVSTQILDLKERKGSLGPMLFIIRETTYINQMNKNVASQRSTYIYYKTERL